MSYAVPKLWFAPTENEASPYNTNQCDCGACSTADDYSDVHPHISKSQVYRQTRSLMRQSCDENHQIVCNPVGRGKVVVLDKASTTFLNFFESPHSLTEILET